MSTGTLDASIGRRFIGYKVERSSDSSCEITIGIARIRKKTVEKRSFLFSCGDPTLYHNFVFKKMADYQSYTSFYSVVFIGNLSEICPRIIAVSY